MSEQTTLRLALCLFNDVTALDYQGPIELFGLLTPKWLSLFGDAPPKYSISIEYLADSREPIEPDSGPHMLAARTFSDVKPDEQFDIILVPGGPAPAVEGVPNSLLEFLRKQAPGAKHVLSVCTGSWILANAGLLKGKRATTNKYSFREVEAATKDKGIEWVAKARWVVDDNDKLWTSSGVTAGADMASAFLDFLVGKEQATIIRGIVELSAKAQDDDEFAEYWGLV
ncbi:hypothetical protein HGRIS_011876 [Hohenbuehelia grisea]|uniref:DJ-1/PfpI domain-containing protein n=1 Tax=Hohenbuehelia grisea TaxID=104357 RepID=A0ABR3JWE9_9AGAR